MSRIGDPACDVMPAWATFLPRPRHLPRRLVIDDASWERGRGWALFVRTDRPAYYHRDQPVLARIARPVEIDAVMTI